MTLAIDRQNEDHLCNIFNVADLRGVQDVLNCILLSESVYRAHERGAEAVVEAFNLFQRSFTPGLITVTGIQCSLPHVQHRYVVGTSDEAMYVAFMGTKAMRDIISDVNYVQTALWPGLLGKVPDVPTAHQGFLARSESVLVELLYAHASHQGKRLVLCGHSLGGAVAQLCALRLLRDLPPHVAEHGSVKCISFAAPPLGNSALANTVSYKGWSSLFYNLALPEDVVPRLMAMQNSASLPAAAAKAMLTEPSEDKNVPESQGLPEQGEPAGPHHGPNLEEEDQDLGMALERAHALDDQHAVERPTEAEVIQASGDRQGQNSSERPPGSPAQAWRSRLRNSLDRLRAFTADLAASNPSTSQPLHASATAPASHATQQPAVLVRNEPAGPLGRAGDFASTAARYLPIYMHIGTQHHLHAPPGEPPLRLTSVQNSAEDAETLAALTDPDTESGAAPGPQQAASLTGSPERQRTFRDRGYLGLSVPTYRSYMSVLTYHRMFAVRRRAAALCAAALGRVQLNGNARPAELCDNIAPCLDVAVACARVPPSRPQFSAPGLGVTGGQQSSRWPNMQWASTLSALTGLIQPARQTLPASAQQPGFSGNKLVQSWWPWQWNGGEAAQSSIGPLSKTGSASGHPEEGTDHQMKPASSTSHTPLAAFSLPRWLWRPWETGGGHGDKADLAAVEAGPELPAAQPRSRQWLSWAGAGARGSAEPPAPSARMSLRIIVRGRGLANCTKARVLAAGGAWCPARIVSSPALPPLHAGSALDTSPAAGWGENTVEGTQSAGTGLWSMGRRFGMLVRERITGRQAEQQAAAEDSHCAEELVLETVLPPAIAGSVERGLLAQHERQGGLLEVQLRSDFFVRRFGVSLQPCTAWVLSDSARGAEMLMGALCAAPALSARCEAPPFSAALAGGVRFVSLWPDTPRAAAFPVMSGLVARRLQATAEQQKAPPALGEQLEPSEEVHSSKPRALEAWQRGPDPDEQHAPRSDYGHPSATLTSRIGRPAARAFSWAADATASVIGHQASSKLATWTVRAREGAGSVRAGFGTQLRLLQHGRVWRALKTQPTPQLLILCLRGSPTGGSRRQAGRIFGQFSSGLRAHAAVSGSGHADDWEAAMGSIAKDAESVRMLLESARAARIPLLVVVMPGSQDSWERMSPLPLELEAASGGTLVLHDCTNQLGSNESWELKMAVYRALSGSVQSPHIRSKL